MSTEGVSGGTGDETLGRGAAQGSTGFLLLNLRPQTTATMWGEWGRFVWLAFGSDHPLLPVWPWLRPFFSLASVSSSVKWASSHSRIGVLYGFYGTPPKGSAIRNVFSKHGPLLQRASVQLPPSVVGPRLGHRAIERGQGGEGIPSPWATPLGTTGPKPPAKSLPL